MWSCCGHVRRSQTRRTHAQASECFISLSNFRQKLTSFIKTLCFSRHPDPVALSDAVPASPLQRDVTRQVSQRSIASVAGVLDAQGSDVTSNSFCKFDVFRPNCNDSHVIEVRAARFGRMRIGRCVTSSSNIGCQADVTGIVASRCAGARRCEVSGADPQLLLTRPCDADVSEYLEVEFSCRRGEALVQNHSELSCLIAVRSYIA